MKNSPSFELFHLLRFEGMTRKKLNQYLQMDPYLRNLKNRSSFELEQIFNFTSDKASNLRKHVHNNSQREFNLQLFQRFSPITIYDADYPYDLKHIPDPPLILYWQGNRELLLTQKIAVIGTRRPSPTAYKKIKTFLLPLLEQNITIVSGLAYGIDAMSHQFAINNGGNTIAILGFGYYHIYPKENSALFNEIIRHGLILSEYPPYIKPKKWHFPERNRIISGISKSVLIIEASERSGTMITADQALEQGKEVYVVPDSIFLEQAKGCLKLLQEGATPVIKGEDLFT